MRLIFVRHGDPDYEIDSLTPKGWREAELLSERVKGWKNITQFYCSPLGRAQDTAGVSLKKIGRTAITLPWLEEIYFLVKDPATGNDHGAWDWFPEYWTAHPEFYQRDWFKYPPFDKTKGDELLLRAASGIDSLLAEYGYFRCRTDFSGNNCDPRLSVPVYHTNHKTATGAYKSNEDTTLVFFCHFGVTAALLAHLFGLPALPMWQNFFCPTTSVTVVAAEERVPGTAAFRAQLIGCTKHLDAGNEPVSASGFFTDVFSL